MNLKAPEVKVPEFSAPEFKLPSFEAPKFEAPKFETPAATSSAPALPSFEAPKFEAPKVALPAGLPALPSFGGSESEEDAEPLEPQEVRDENARVANNKFKELDENAKVRLDHFIFTAFTQLRMMSIAHMIDELKCIVLGY